MYAVAPKGTARPACAHSTMLVNTWVVACRRASYLVPSERLSVSGLCRDDYLKEKKNYALC